MSQGLERLVHVMRHEQVALRRHADVLRRDVLRVNCTGAFDLG